MFFWKKLYSLVYCKRGCAQKWGEREKVFVVGVNFKSVWLAHVWQQYQGTRQSTSSVRVSIVCRECTTPNLSSSLHSQQLQCKQLQPIFIFIQYLFMIKQHHIDTHNIHVLLGCQSQSIHCFHRVCRDVSNHVSTQKSKQLDSSNCTHSFHCKIMLYDDNITRI